MKRIFKFGGASVKDAASIRNLLNIVKGIHKESHLVIVISAMGKTTRKLEDVFNLAFSSHPFKEDINSIRHYHEQIASELLGRSSERIGELLDQLEQILDNVSGREDYYRHLDEVLSFGELLSTRLISEFLKTELDCIWLDAREILITDSSFGEAKIDWESTNANIQSACNFHSAPIYIIQGFIGSDGLRTTTLGKEGSDFTAAVVANCIDAENMTVWKDVAGIMNADPKRMSNTEVYDKLSYQEIAEMTYYGAKVIHPKTITPLAKKGIPLFVKSFIDPAKPGTTIAKDIEEKVSVPTFIIQSNQALFTVRIKDGSFLDEKKMIEILQVLQENNVKVNMMQMSALTFTFCFDERKDKLDRVLDILQEKFLPTYNSNLTLATIKNYNQNSEDLLPSYQQIILEQKSRSVFHRLYI